MASASSGSRLAECALDQWPLRERLEALTFSINTLSGILVLLECDAEPRSISEIHTRIATEAFGTESDEFGAIGWGTIQSKLKALSKAFSLVHGFEETRPPTEGRGGRMEATAVQVFEKDPRGFWFGDPVTARTLSVCADLERSPVDIFTSAEKKGATRAPFVTALVLQFLGSQGIVSRKEIITGCFWDPTDRAEYRQLRSRVNKNVTRLAECGLVDAEYTQQAIFRHTGKPFETYPRRSDGSQIISETDRILSYLDGRDAVHRQDLLTDVRTSHSAGILKHLREEGVVERLQGGMDERSSVALTPTGETVVADLINPLFHAIHPDLSFTFDSPVEYERVWRDAPAVDAAYLDGAFREVVRMYNENPQRYRADTAIVNEIDQNQNPWR